MLAQALEQEKKKWLSKDGVDWSSVFGKDPAKYAGKESLVYEDEEDKDVDNDIEDSDSFLGRDLDIYYATSHDYFVES